MLITLSQCHITALSRPNKEMQIVGRKSEIKYINTSPPNSHFSFSPNLKSFLLCIYRNRKIEQLSKYLSSPNVILRRWGATRIKIKLTVCLFVDLFNLNSTPNNSILRLHQRILPCPFSLPCGHNAGIIPWKKDLHYCLPTPGGH